MARALAEGSPTLARSRGRPTQATVMQIDQEILHAARELFLSHGYEGTSMAMVTKVAGVSKTTLYARYATKADLFRATVLLTVDLIANQALGPEERQAHELADGLNIFGCEAMRISLTPLWSGYERLAYTEGSRFPELTNAVVDRVHVGIQTVSWFIRDCAGREGATLHDPDGVATTYVLALRGFYMAAVLQGRTPDDEEIAAFVGRLVGLLMAAKESW